MLDIRPSQGHAGISRSRLRRLNASYLAIPNEIRGQVNIIFESFVLDHIHMRLSCAFETTLRSDVTFRQADLAKAAGFTTEMTFVALDNFPMHFTRVKERAFAGGHSAPAPLLESIYRSSLADQTPAWLTQALARL